MAASHSVTRGAGAGGGSSGDAAVRVVMACANAVLIAVPDSGSTQPPCMGAPLPAVCATMRASRRSNVTAFQGAAGSMGGARV